jgi:hypothetical protein
MNHLVEWELTAETEVQGENLPPEPICPPQISHLLSFLTIVYDAQEIYVFVLCLSLGVIKNEAFHPIIEVYPL